MGFYCPGVLFAGRCEPVENDETFWWNNPEETEKVFRDGWLKTSDIGFMNVDGCVTIVARKKELRDEAPEDYYSKI